MAQKLAPPEKIAQIYLQHLQLFASLPPSALEQLHHDKPQLNIWKEELAREMFICKNGCEYVEQVYWSTCYCFALFYWGPPCKGSQQETNRCPKEAIRGGNKLFEKRKKYYLFRREILRLCFVSASLQIIPVYKR